MEHQKKLLLLNDADVSTFFKKQEGGFIGALLSPLVTSIEQPVIFLVVKGISGRGVRRAGRSEVK